MIDVVVENAANAFLAQSEEQTAMSNIYIEYNGLVPAAEAFKIVDLNETKIVDESGLIVPMATAEFVGGVIFKLAELDVISHEDWTPARVIKLGMRIGSKLGAQKEHQDTVRSAAKSLTATA